MASFYTDIGAIQNAPSLTNRMPAGKLTPKTFVANGRYVVTGTEVATDKIYIAKLPEGSQVIPHLSQVDSDGVGATTATLSFGDEDFTKAGVAAGSVTRYGTAADVNAAGKDLFDGATRGAASNLAYTLQTDSWIVATFATLTGTPTAGRVLNFRVAFNSLLNT